MPPCLSAQVGIRELLRLLFMPAFLLWFGWIGISGARSGDEHGQEAQVLAWVVWAFALWPGFLFFRTLLERLKGRSRVLINASGIRLAALGHQPIAWAQIERIEVLTRQTLDHAGTKNLILNLLRRNYKVYQITLKDKGEAAAGGKALEIVPIALSVSEEQVEAALAHWLSPQITEGPE